MPVSRSVEKTFISLGGFTPPYEQTAKSGGAEADMIEVRNR